MWNEPIIDRVVPVTVVGGGPVGLSTALELQHHGVPVLLIEPRTRVEHSRPRAKTTSTRTMEHFRRWGVADRLRSVAPLPASWSQRVTFVRHVLGEEITHLDDCLGLATPREVSPETAQQVSQGIVEDILREAVAERPGITVRYGWTVIELEQHEDHVVLTALTPEQEEVLIKSDWVVGADGPRSVVRRAMSVEYQGAAGGRPNVNITFRSADLAGVISHPPSIHYWVLDAKCPGVVGPLDLKNTWWAISTGTASIGSDQEAQRIVRGLVGSDIDVEIVATDPWQARMLIAENYRDRRLFLVGDAAHQTPPWGGHGFNTGVGDAANLGWKLAATVNGWGGPDLLDSYNAERRPIAEQTIQLARTNMQSLSIDLSTTVDPHDLSPDEHAALVNNIHRQKAAEFYSEGLVLGYRYTHDPTDETDHPGRYVPTPKPGSRLPHEIVGDRSLYDLLGPQLTAIGPKHKLRELLDRAEHAGIPLHHIDHGTDVVLVRPDQHIIWSGTTIPSVDRLLHIAINGLPARWPENTTPQVVPASP